MGYYFKTESAATVASMRWTEHVGVPSFVKPGIEFPSRFVVWTSVRPIWFTQRLARQLKLHGMV